MGKGTVEKTSWRLGRIMRGKRESDFALSEVWVEGGNK